MVTVVLGEVQGGEPVAPDPEGVVEAFQVGKKGKHFPGWQLRGNPKILK